MTHSSRSVTGWWESLLVSLRFFSLRPYGDTLLTDTARAWFAMVYVLMIMIATMEALFAGAALGALILGTGSSSFAAALGFGAGAIVVYVLIRCADSFVALADVRAFGGKEASLGFRLVMVWRWAVEHKQVWLRGGLVTMTLLLTFPAIDRLVLVEDARSAVLEEREQPFQRELTVRAGAYSAQRSALMAEKAAKQDSANMEWRGALEGGVGRGSRHAARVEAVRQVDERIADLERSHGRSVGEIQARMQAALRAPITPGELDSAVVSLREAGEGSGLILFLRAIWVMLYLVFFLAKAFQHAHVKIYLDFELQARWGQYSRGELDRYLEPRLARLRLISPMDPVGFDMWYYPGGKRAIAIVAEIAARNELAVTLRNQIDEVRVALDNQRTVVRETADELARAKEGRRATEADQVMAGVRAGKARDKFARLEGEIAAARGFGDPVLELRSARYEHELMNLSGEAARLEECRSSSSELVEDAKRICILLNARYEAAVARMGSLELALARLEDALIACSSPIGMKPALGLIK